MFLENIAQYTEFVGHEHDRFLTTRLTGQMHENNEKQGILSKHCAVVLERISNWSGRFFDQTSPPLPLGNGIYTSFVQAVFRLKGRKTYGETRALNSHESPPRYAPLYPYQTKR